MLIRETMFVVISLSLILTCSAQDQLPDGCYTGASIFGAVVFTLVVVLLLLAGGYLLWRMHYRSKKGRHLILETDPEKGPAEFAFDNPVFREGTPVGRTSEKEDQKLQVKWPCWTPMNGLNKSVKPKAFDDSYLGQPMLNVVPLRSHDFTGLGFNICGNMRDGIFVKDVLHRGPASESGRISSGDRIESVRISFRHMVFEDALAILSYASPYEVQLEVENGSSSRPSTLLRNKRSSVSPPERICHPFYRSQSITDIFQVKKSGSYRMSPEQHPSISEISNGDLSKPAIIETSPIDKMQKFGVRVLPPPEPIKLTDPEKHQNVRNSMIENIQMQGSSSPNILLKSNMLSSQMEEIDLSDGNNYQSFDEVDLSSRKGTPSPALKENNMKSILVKGIQNLKEKLQPIVQKLEKDTDDSKDNDHHKGEEKLKEIELFSEKNFNDAYDIDGIQKDSDFDKFLINGTSKNEFEISNSHDVPEEVQKAGMAARNNRKSMTEFERKRKDSSGAESSNDGDGQQISKKGKRKAPQPPQMNYTCDPSNTKDDYAAEAILEDFSERNKRVDLIDTDSESGDKSYTTIELNESHITVHHAPDSDTNRKAASLGDLSRINDEPPIVILERAVSLDLADGAPSGSKKRKAPMPPQGEELSDDGGTPFIKGARLDNGIKARLKKSSDWGTLEDAVKCTDSFGHDSDEDEIDAGISGCSTPEKSTNDSIVCSTPYHPLNPSGNFETLKNMQQVSNCSWELSATDLSNDQFITAVNGTCEDENNDYDIPPELPTSPMPTYITEIQVVTSSDKGIPSAHIDYIKETGILNNQPKTLHSFRTSDNLSNLLFEPTKTTCSSLEIKNDDDISDVLLPNFALSGLSRNNGNMLSPIESDTLKPFFPEIINNGDACQVLISQPNSLNTNPDTLSGGIEANSHLKFSNENMSDEQILALKSTSPEPIVVENSSPINKLEIVKPERQQNVSVTSIKATGSRIPVRTPPEPSQRKVKWSEPGSFISYSSLNVSGNGEKPMLDQNGTENVTQIILDPPK